MINVVDYINLILLKKNMSRRDLTNKLNQLEDKLGDTRTSFQNITNYLNNTDGEHNIGYKMALKLEKALELPDDTLLNMVKQPTDTYAIKNFKELKKKVREL